MTTYVLANVLAEYKAGSNVVSKQAATLSAALGTSVDLPMLATTLSNALELTGDLTQAFQTTLPSATPWGSLATILGSGFSVTQGSYSVVNGNGVLTPAADGTVLEVGYTHTWSNVDVDLAASTKTGFAYLDGGLLTGQFPSDPKVNITLSGGFGVYVQSNGDLGFFVDSSKTVLQVGPLSTSANFSGDTSVGALSDVGVTASVALTLSSIGLTFNNVGVASGASTITGSTSPVLSGTVKGSAVITATLPFLGGLSSAPTVKWNPTFNAMITTAGLVDPLLQTNATDLGESLFSALSNSLFSEGGSLLDSGGDHGQDGGGSPLLGPLSNALNAQLPLIGKSIAQLTGFDKDLPTANDDPSVPDDSSLQETLGSLGVDIGGQNAADVSLSTLNSLAQNWASGTKGVDLLNWSDSGTVSLASASYEVPLLSLGVPGIASAEIDATFGLSASLDYNVGFGFDTSGFYFDTPQYFNTAEYLSAHPGQAAQASPHTLGLTFSADAGLEGEVEVLGFPLADAGGEVGFQISPGVNLTAPSGTATGKVYLGQLEEFGADPADDLLDAMSADVAGDLTGSVYANVNLLFVHLGWSWGIDIPVFDIHDNADWAAVSGGGTKASPSPFSLSGSTLTFTAPTSSTVNTAEQSVDLTQNPDGSISGTYNGAAVEFPYDGTEVATLPAGAATEFVYHGNGGVDQLITSPGFGNEAGHVVKVVADIQQSTGAIIEGGNGGVTVNGGSGSETLMGGTGNDSLTGGTNSTDTIIGGDGNDVLTAGPGPEAAVIYTGSDSSTVTGNAGNDSIYAGGGNDTINAGSGVFFVDGGTGNDTINGFTKVASDATIIRQVQVSAASATVTNKKNTVAIAVGSNQYPASAFSTGEAITGYGIPDDTTITGVSQSGNTTTLTLSAADLFPTGDTRTTAPAAVTVGGFPGDNTDAIPIIHAGSGNDTIHLGAAPTEVDGGSGSDTVYGDSGQDTIYGGSGGGNLIVGGGSGSAGPGNVIYSGSQPGTAADTLIGGNGNNTLYGGGGNDVIYGGVSSVSNGKLSAVAGNAPTLTTTAQWQSPYAANAVGSSDVGDNLIIAGSGNQVLYGATAGQNTLVGGAGKDVLYAGVGTSTGSGDDLEAGSGPSTLYGGNGNDVLSIPFTPAGSTTAADVLVGGPGFNDLALNPTNPGPGTLTENLSAATTGVKQTITVSNGNDITSAQIMDKAKGGYFIEVDYEQMEVIAIDVNGNSDAITVLRGMDGTVATSHTSGTTVEADPDFATPGGYYISLAASTKASNQYLATLSNLSSTNTAGTPVGQLTVGLSSTIGQLVLEAGDASIPSSDGIAPGNTAVVVDSGVTLNVSIFGGNMNDTLVGGAGSDTIVAGTGSSVLDGGAGDDILYAGDLPADDILGGPATQLSSEGSGTDTLIGGLGNNQLYAANRGNDVLIGGIATFISDKYVPGLGTLAAQVTATATTITLSTAPQIPEANIQAGFFIQVDGELMKVNSISGATLTVARAQDSTLDVMHAAGATVEPAGVVNPVELLGEIVDVVPANATATTLLLTSSKVSSTITGAQIASGYYIQVDSECMRVTAVTNSGFGLTVVRAQEATPLSVHLNGAVVDSVNATSGNVNVLDAEGGTGNNLLIAGPGSSGYLYAGTASGSGSDTLVGDNNSSDLLVGGNGPNTLLGGNYQNVELGGSGPATLVGGAGDDLLQAGSGAQSLFADESSPYLDATASVFWTNVTNAAASLGVTLPPLPAPLPEIPSNNIVGGAGSDSFYGGGQGTTMSSTLAGPGTISRFYDFQNGDTILGGAKSINVVVFQGDGMITTRLIATPSGNPEVQISVGSTNTVTFGNGLNDTSGLDRVELDLGSGNDTVTAIGTGVPGTQGTNIGLMIVAGSGTDTVNAESMQTAVTLMGGSGTDTFKLGDTLAGGQVSVIGGANFKTELDIIGSSAGGDVLTVSDGSLIVDNSKVSVSDLGKLVLEGAPSVTNLLTTDGSIGNDEVLVGGNGADNTFQVYTGVAETGATVDDGTGPGTVNTVVTSHDIGGPVGSWVQPGGDVLVYDEYNSTVAQYDQSAVQEQYASPTGLVTTYPTVLSDVMGTTTVLPDGDLVDVVAGGIECYAANGSVDTAFGIDGVAALPLPSGYTGIEEVDAIIADPKGRLMILYQPYNASGPAVGPFLCRLDSNGTIDTSFGTQGATDPRLYADTQVDGFGGYFIACFPSGNYAVSDGLNIVGLNASGSLLTYGNDVPPGSSPLDDQLITSLTVDPKTGDLLVGGLVNFSEYESGQDEPFVARLTASLQLDTTFNSVGYVVINSVGSMTGQVVADPDGNVLVVAIPDNLHEASTREAVYELNSNGTADTSFASHGVFTTALYDIYDMYISNSASILSNGQLLVVGSTNPIFGGVSGPTLAFSAIAV